MKILVLESLRTWQSLGKVHYGPTESEKDSIKFRRSIYVVKNIEKGEKLTAKNIRIIRPGKGLHPKHYEKLIGKQIKINVKEGTALTWEMLE